MKLIGGQKIMATRPKTVSSRPSRKAAPVTARNSRRSPKPGLFAKRNSTGLLVFTIGHSTRSMAEFIDLLRLHGVTGIADVRTIPRSRHNPQFNQSTLRRSLHKARLSYVHLPGLGGLRHTRRDSVNTGWRNSSFRGYADYMQTPEFTAALDEFIRLARKGRLVLMCAEAVPWRCHRSLIADALLIRKIPVEDITGPGRSRPHKLTSFAKTRGKKITYPAPA